MIGPKKYAWLRKMGPIWLIALVGIFNNSFQFSQRNLLITQLFNHFVLLKKQ